jgi:nanoRNase/pAp phosphatase (c-di-AMP/oligoRNAs hydrolase)
MEGSQEVGEHLESLLKAIDGVAKLLILPHNDPDPDAIASAVALRYLLEQKLGVQSEIAYQGIVGRAENKALVRYLDHPLRRLTYSDLRQSVPIALVDTQPSAGNNAVLPQVKVTVVIDHHTWREETAEVDFYDVRPGLGATSTMLVGYLRDAGIEPPPQLATALFYGIKTDTMGLARGASPEDVAAYFGVHSQIDVEALVEIERAQVPIEYFKKLDAALHAARVYDGVTISYMGLMNRPDMAAEMADFLLRLQGTQWTICMGAYEGELILSVRTRGRMGGAGRLAQEIVGERGTAGGHGAMAGGQILLGDQDPELLAEKLGKDVLERLKIGPGVQGRPVI